MGSDDEERIALADIDGGDFQGCGAVQDRSWKDCNSGCDKKGRGGGGEGETFEADEHQPCRGEDDDGGDGEWLGRGNAEIAETHGSEGEDERVDAVQEERHRRGGNEGEFWKTQDQQ